jgi:uncharacterized protein with PQ loop repeat
MFASPYPTILEIQRAKTTAKISPMSYFSMLANGYLQIAYGISAGFDRTIISTNISALLFGGYYSAQFVRYSSGEFPLTPYYNGVGATFAAVTALVVSLPAKSVQSILGWLSLLIAAAFFGGPLQGIGDVLKTKSTRNLPFPMAVATAVNSVLWVGYGKLVTNDPFIYGPNIVGFTTSLIQLGLFAVYGIQRIGDGKGTEGGADKNEAVA